ncbi:MAG: hypothetical protein LBM07_03525 [Culturomica sp.]|jgi:hypothetical protein|nr:hypothetical protein [Culturomica sp.]
MKTRLFLIIMLITSLLSTSANASSLFKEEVKKIVTKNYPVKSDPKLSIDSKYGNIDIIEWDRQEINFSVEIIGKADNKEDAEVMVNRVSIDFSKNGNSISAKTVFEDTPNKYRRGNTSTTVNYTVNVPKDVYMNLINKYGNIKVGTVYKDFEVDVKYGNLSGDNLLSENNDLNVKYGNIGLDNCKNATINIAYGSCNVKNIDNLVLTQAYSNFKATKIGSLELTSKYDNFNIGEVTTLSATAAYSTLKIGKLNNSLVIGTIKYGNIKVNEVALDFSKINIDAAYTDINLGIGKEHNFHSELYTRYGNIRTGDITFSVKFNEEGGVGKSSKSAAWHGQNKYVLGIAGKEKDPKATVKIINSYSDIVLQ